MLCKGDLKFLRVHRELQRFQEEIIDKFNCATKEELHEAVA